MKQYVESVISENTDLKQAIIQKKSTKVSI